MSNIDYYKDLTIQGKELVYNRAMEDFKEVYNIQNNNNTVLKREIANILLVYTILNDKLKLSRADKNKVMNKLFTLIEHNSLKEYHTEVNKLKSILEFTANNTTGMYYYIKHLGKDTKYKKLTKKAKYKIIEDGILGINYNDRIKENKRKNEISLKKIVQLLLLSEITVNEVNSLLDKQFNYNAYISNRLAGTEITRVQAGTDEELYSNNKVQKVLYLATLDFKTCEECADLDGTTYNIDDINRPELPQHTNCRCCYCDIPDEDWRPNSRRDNRFTGSGNDKYIDYLTYKEWFDIVNR